MVKHTFKTLADHFVDTRGHKVNGDDVLEEQKIEKFKDPHCYKHLRKLKIDVVKHKKTKELVNKEYNRWIRRFL